MRQEGLERWTRDWVLQGYVSGKIFGILPKGQVRPLRELKQGRKEFLFFSSLVILGKKGLEWGKSVED